MDKGEKLWILETLTAREVEILKHLAEGLTDREIASRLFISVNTVKWHNQQIYSKLGVSSRRKAVSVASVAGALETMVDREGEAERKPLHNLPAPVTSFVGRIHEIQEVQSLLEKSRMLSITGPPGVGKSRLALQVARNAVGDFADGVFIVDLVPIRDPANAIDSIARVLSVRKVAGEGQATTVSRFLSDKNMLLVLDTFEHLLEAGPETLELLKAASDCKFLVTSREPLRVYGEKVYPLQPLSNDEAFDLYCRRARAVNPSFDPGDEQGAIEQLCTMLDGLPLAIELAAARAAVIPPRSILQQLGNLLASSSGTIRGMPDRHRNLRTAINWSYNLLTSSEKTLFRRLGVFAGGCTLEAVEAVCCDGVPMDLHDGLEALINKGLLELKEGFGDAPRFRMLVIIQAYSMQQLEEKGELYKTRERHAAHYLEMAVLAEPQLAGPEIHSWRLRIDQELDNFRLAFDWLIGDGGNAAQALRLCIAIDHILYVRHPMAGYRWGESLLRKRSALSPDELVQALTFAGRMENRTGGQPRDTEKLMEAVALCNKETNPLIMASAMVQAGQRVVFEIDPPHGQELIEKALVTYKELGHRGGMARCLNDLGEVARYRGDFEKAKIYYEEANQLSPHKRSVGDTMMDLNLGSVYRNLGDSERAWEIYEKVYSHARKNELPLRAADCLSGWAGILIEHGKLELAATLLSTAEAVEESIGSILEPADKSVIDRDIVALRERLDRETLDAAWKRGRAMTLDDAATLAMEAQVFEQQKD